MNKSKQKVNKSQFISKQIRKLTSEEHPFCIQIIKILGTQCDRGIVGYIPKELSFDNKTRELILSKDIVNKITLDHGLLIPENLIINIFEWDYATTNMDNNPDRINLIKLVPNSKNYLLVAATRINGFYILTHFETETNTERNLKRLLGRGNVLNRVPSVCLHTNQDGSHQLEKESSVKGNICSITGTTKLSNVCYNPLMALPEKYKSPYESSKVEGPVYDRELNSGFFTPENLVSAFPLRYEKSEAWTTITPPPNANGRLHAGHALDVTLKDIIGRFKRMNNKRVLMLPGSDHAGFETQVVYEKKLEKEGRSRFGMDRDLLYKEIYDFTIANKDTVAGEVKRIGASYDWSRDTFTLDAKVVSGVQDTFIKMYNDGLVYRSKRDVNWCSKHQTSLSDVETTNKEMTDTFYTFKIGEFLIGTSRPETKFGDKYIVVHPEDARYSKYSHGDTFEAEWILGPTTFTVIKDESIDMEFGTGAMTITPWHSSIDFDIAKKHGLDMVQVIDENGKLMEIAGELKGLRAITEGRKRTVELLESKGLLVEKNEKYTHVVPVCYKCETPIEPQLKDQWFIKMKPLAEKALEASKKGEINFVTDQFRKTYEYWMSNPIDWNISRQIVWGIRIPAWFKNKGTETEEYYIGHDNPGAEWIQDIDTFDTWFSSGQWPVATLGFIGGKDMSYYPTQLMETGRDLVFKWVPRMVIFGLYLTGEVPFKDIYLHGMALDEKGQKMSKSKGNVMSPIDLADEFGMDALRMSLIVGSTPGNDVSMSKDKIRAYKKFVNKLWNITRFVLENTEGVDGVVDMENEKVKRITEVKETIAKHINEYQLHLGAEELYHYVWHEFADVVIEDVKKDLTDENKSLLRYMLKEILTMAHPFMPFVTEEIWSDVRSEGEVELLLVKEW